jgi:hypothetical protein
MCLWETEISWSSLISRVPQSDANYEIFREILTTSIPWLITLMEGKAPHAAQRTVQWQSTPHLTSLGEERS